MSRRGKPLLLRVLEPAQAGAQKPAVVGASAQQAFEAVQLLVRAQERMLELALAFGLSAHCLGLVLALQGLPYEVFVDTGGRRLAVAGTQPWACPDAFAAMVWAGSGMHTQTSAQFLVSCTFD
jgi:hypothetical protein